MIMNCLQWLLALFSLRMGCVMNSLKNHTNKILDVWRKLIKQPISMKSTRVNLEVESLILHLDSKLVIMPIYPSITLLLFPLLPTRPSSSTSFHPTSSTIGMPSAFLKILASNYTRNFG